MKVKLEGISLSDFKAYGEKQEIKISDINILLGANSSGKSSCIQSLLALKQTCESKQEHIGLLLTGKYTNIGSFRDVLHENLIDKEKEKHFSIGIEVNSGIDDEASENLKIYWTYYNNPEFINGVGIKSLRLEGDKRILLELNAEGSYDLTIGRRKTTRKDTP